MAKAVSSAILILILNLVIFTLLSVAIPTKKRKANTDGLYDCLWKQVCECNLPARYAECYDYLTQEST
ncbi:UNVERIFIED_CONTAM: hypothetical protein NCL1_45547 [Trichonephila clavipes]